MKTVTSAIQQALDPSGWSGPGGGATNWRLDLYDALDLAGKNWRTADTSDFNWDGKDIAVATVKAVNGLDQMGAEDGDATRLARLLARRLQPLASANSNGKKYAQQLGITAGYIWADTRENMQIWAMVPTGSK